MQSLENLSTLVSKRFTTAKETGHLTLSLTELAVLRVRGVLYQLRYCPSLAKKPVPQSQTTTASTETETSQNNAAQQPKQKPDPFANPPEDLLIAHLPTGTHSLILNKFPIIRNHFILATREWKAQDWLLDKGDLGGVFSCLRGWNGSDSSSRLFAFYNSGEQSGASQSHRHVQFLPVEEMRDEGDSGRGDDCWEPVIDLITTSATSTTTTANNKDTSSNYKFIPNLPFAHFALPIPPDPSPDTLHAIYLDLYRAALSFTTTNSGETEPTKTTENDIKSSGKAEISYNLAMTLSTMMICPRRSEKSSISIPSGNGNGNETGDEIETGVSTATTTTGVVSVNGTVLAGTVMVKGEAEWELLRRRPECLGGVLGDVGYSWDGRASL